MNAYFASRRYPPWPHATTLDCAIFNFSRINHPVELFIDSRVLATSKKLLIE